MDAEEALKRLVEEEKDNSKLILPLFHFNDKCDKTSKAESQTPWIIYNSGELLSIVKMP